MAGHSHWAQIKRQKGLNDAKKAKIFTKLARQITYAARSGGGDPSFNPTLASAIEQARKFNLPKNRIDKAIKLGTGELDTGPLEEITYEGYGPGGVAFLVKTLTDNRNRAVAEIRNIFSKHNGTLGSAGSAAYVFGEDPENPAFTIHIEDKKTTEQLLKLADALEEHDDVQDVFMNAEVEELNDSNVYN